MLVTSQEGHPVSTVDHQGLHATDTVCVAYDDHLSCSTDGGGSSTVDVTWVEQPSEGATVVDAGDNGWWEVDQNLLLPLDQTAYAVSDQPVTVSSAGAWDQAQFDVTSVLGWGPWPAVAILVLLAAVLGFAAWRKHQQDPDAQGSSS